MADYTDPFRAYQFKLMIQGVTEGHFTQCTGLGAQVEVIRYREAGNNQIVHYLPGQIEYSDVVLRYGVTESTELWDWFMATVRGEVQRKNVSILLLDNEGAGEMMRFDLNNAWPRAWQAAPLDALSQQVAIESLTLVFESVERG